MDLNEKDLGKDLNEKDLNEENLNKKKDAQSNNETESRNENIRGRINEIIEEASASLREIIDNLDDAESAARLEFLRLHMLGKKGQLTGIMRAMRDLSPEERPIIGAIVNEERSRLEERLKEIKSRIEDREMEARLEKEHIDVTAPGKAAALGKLHPITQVTRKIRDIFIGMGFTVKEGPEIELVKYNFDLLNLPFNHPARDPQDTFYIGEDKVLRTHTSPVQVRTMLSQDLPIRMVCPGRVFRSDDVDATHSPVFNQIEGLVIDKGITMGDLVGCLELFAKEMYGSDTRIRLRPSYFPFTEPSTEVDISCTMCGGKGCRVCKGSGWIELLGSGMVHPNVLRMCGIDPEIYSGFAFGLGLDRIANMKHEISDIRLLYENDIRFLEQF